MPLHVPPSPAPHEAPIQPAVQPHHQQPEVTPRRQLIQRPTPPCADSVAPLRLHRRRRHAATRSSCPAPVASPTAVSAPQSFLPPRGASIHSQGAAQPPASRGATQPSLFHLQ
ncbi:hypothetical protein VPH35_027856 [Triticum aestivum]